MKQLMHRFITHPLLAGSVIMFVGSNLSHFFQYLYHPLMSRLLGLTVYGEMSALFSLTILVGTIPSTLNLVIVKIISSAKTPGEFSRFLRWIYSKSFFFGISTFLICLIFSRFIANFLHLPEYSLVGLVGLVFIPSFPLIVLRSTLQGLTKFTQLVISLCTEGVLKLILGYILVSLGFSLFGAILGVIISSFLTWGLSHLFVSKFLGSTDNLPVNLRPFLIFSAPVIVNNIASASLFSTDVVLAKHFLSPESTGIYAALSALGKMILFGVGPISSVMFPLVSRHYARGERFIAVFFSGLLLVSLAGIVTVFTVKYLPELIISLLFGPEFLPAIPHLFLFSISTVIYALAFYLLNFNLSVDHLKAAILPAIAAVIQIIALNIFHSDVTDFIHVSLAISAIFFISSAVYTFFRLSNVKITSKAVS